MHVPALANLCRRAFPSQTKNFKILGRKKNHTVGNSTVNFNENLRQKPV
jgi:hypothetical protein